MSRRPHTIHRIDKKVEQKILQIRKQHRYYPDRIKEILQNQYNIKVGHMTVYQILCKNGPSRYESNYIELHLLVKISTIVTIAKRFSYVLIIGKSMHCVNIKNTNNTKY